MLRVLETELNILVFMRWRRNMQISAQTMLENAGTLFELAKAGQPLLVGLASHHQIGWEGNDRYVVFDGEGNHPTPIDQLLKIAKFPQPFQGDLDFWRLQLELALENPNIYLYAPPQPVHCGMTVWLTFNNLSHSEQGQVARIWFDWNEDVWMLMVEFSAVVYRLTLKKPFTVQRGKPLASLYPLIK
jgi:hypothetical protein